MKHVVIPSPVRLPGLLTQDQLRTELRKRLGYEPNAKADLATCLGVCERTLTKMLRGGAIGPEIAERLGFRVVTLFERID